MIEKDLVSELGFAYVLEVYAHPCDTGPASYGETNHIKTNRKLVKDSETKISVFRENIHHEGAFEYEVTIYHLR